MTVDHQPRYNDNFLFEVIVPKIIGLDEFEGPLSKRTVPIDTIEMQILKQKRIIDSTPIEIARMDIGGKRALSIRKEIADAFEGHLDWVLVQLATDKIPDRNNHRLVLITYSIEPEDYLHPPNEYHFLLGWIKREELQHLKDNASMLFSPVTL